MTSWMISLYLSRSQASTQTTVDCADLAWSLGEGSSSRAPWLLRSQLRSCSQSMYLGIQGWKGHKLNRFFISGIFFKGLAFLWFTCPGLLEGSYHGGHSVHSHESLLRSFHGRCNLTHFGMIDSRQSLPKSE